MGREGRRGERVFERWARRAQDLLLLFDLGELANLDLEHLVLLFDHLLELQVLRADDRLVQGDGETAELAESCHVLAKKSNVVRWILGHVLRRQEGLANLERAVVHH